MLNTKKYLIVGIIGLLISIFGGILLIDNPIKNKLINSNFMIGLSPFNKNLGNKSIFEYIPNDFDQIFYFNMQDSNVKEFVDFSFTGNVTDEMKKYLFQTNKVIIYQGMIDKNPISFAILNLKKDFDFQGFKNSSFFVNEGDYDVKYLGNDNYLYGEKEAIRRYNEVKFENIYNNGMLNKYIDGLNSNEANIGFISNFSGIDEKYTSLNGIGEYLSHLKYNVLMTKIDENGIKGTINILFDKNIEQFDNYKYTSVFKDYAVKNNFAFLEIGSIYEMLGIDEKQLITRLKLASQDTIFTDQDFEEIINIFKGNIGFSITQADNPYGIGGEIFVQGDSLFNLGSKYSPFVKEFASKYSGSGSLQVIEDKDSISLVASQLLNGTIINGTIQLSKKENNSHLTILMPKYDKIDEKFNLIYDEKSLFHFYINIGLIINKLKTYELFLGPDFSEIIDAFKYFENKALYGNLSIKNEGVIFNFETN